MSRIRFVTFNIRYGSAKDGPDSWPHRKNAVADLIQKHGSEARTMVGLQEAEYPQYLELLGLLGTDIWCGVFAGRNDGQKEGEGTAIVWKQKEFFCLSKPSMFWFSDTPDVPGSQWDRYKAKHPRFCLQGRFEALDGSKALFDCWVVHFDYYGPEVRAKSAEMVAERIKQTGDRTVVFMGDTNAPPKEPAIRVLRATFPVDALLVADPTSDKQGTYHAFTGAPDTHIDYVFVKASVVVEKAGIDRSTYLDSKGVKRWPSDHFAVWGDVVVPGMEGGRM
jgi:endonuclease/exonuclease/phosphatase family metal-dependent hydrolase